MDPVILNKAQVQELAISKAAVALLISTFGDYATRVEWSLSPFWLAGRRLPVDVILPTSSRSFIQYRWACVIGASCLLRCRRKREIPKKEEWNEGNVEDTLQVEMSYVD